MNQALRTPPYSRRISNYSQYRKTTKNTKQNNGGTVLAKKIVWQSLFCIIVVFLVIWLQGKDQEMPQNIVSVIRQRVVERNVTPNDIYQSFADTYAECVQYIQGTD